MYRTIVFELTALVLGACSSDFLIRDAKQDPHDHGASGTTEGLSDIIEGAPHRIEILLVHGVGDHCAGFGLDDRDGWLNADRATALGLTPDGPATFKTLADPDNHNASGPDPRSGYYVGRRLFHHAGRERGTRDVEVIEITWSGLTSWVKTNQLGFDLSKPIPGKADSLSCPPFTEATNDRPRQIVNGQLKEGVLDQRLADAVLYVGSYGAKLNHILAEVLCRITSVKDYG